MSINNDIFFTFRHGITVLGVSSDGDWRPLNSMRYKTKFDINPLLEIEYSSLSNNDWCYVQDTTHIGTKLRNRLLKASILLPFGNKIISLSHLKMLLDTVPKDKHGLVYKDISPDDRQNYASLEKIMEERVLQALKQNVFDSEATIIFLKICKWVTSSYLDVNLQPRERIYYIWHAVFVLRFWRNWILSSSRYNLNDNFISENAYICVELNALNMLHLIVKLRDAGKPEWFLTHLFDSQPCESTFRQMRSMGTINYTKINFTLLELFHLVERVELQNEIVHNRLAHTDIIFPRVKERVKHNHVYDLPLNEQMTTTLKVAQEDAKKIAIEFGIFSESFEVERCPVKKPNIVLQRQLNASDSENDDHYQNSLILDDENKLNLREYSDKKISLEENSKFIEICYPDETKQVVRKSSIVGLLSVSTKKLSSDRLKRVQDSTQSIDYQQSSKRFKLNHDTKSQNDQLIHKCEEIVVGEWCIFAWDFDIASSTYVTEEQAKDNIIKNTIIGTVLGFQYPDGTTDKKKQYRKDTAPISQKDVSVLSNWYAINTGGILISLKCSAFYVPINKYLATIENSRKHIQIAKENLNILHEIIST